MKNPTFLVYDIESIPDLELFRRIKYPKADDPEHAQALFRDDQLKEGKIREDQEPFIPLTFHLPVSCVVLKVASTFEPIGPPVSAFGDCLPQRRSEALTENFWQGIQAYKPILVDFNGRAFDLPVLAMNALRLGISCPAYFNADRFGYRYRYSDRHIDLLDWITEYGAFRLTGGLDLCAKLTGGKGKTGTSGSDVKTLWEAGRIEEIDSYCAQDVVDTYRLFLRTRRLMGLLTEEREATLMEFFA